MSPLVVPNDPTGYAAAARVLRDGGVVALPTDTVYGIAVALGTAGGIDRLFEAKRRPADRAIMLLLDDAEQAAAVAAWPPSARALTEAFWPGGLTVIVDQRPGANLPPELTAGRATVGLRVPNHDCPRALAAAVGPLPVTSANLSGLPPARDAAEIATQLGDAVDCIVDGGPAGGGPASTVVDCTVEPARIVRAGDVSIEAVTACLRAAGLEAPSGA
ncbi:MAG TPA: L-threonylcarbamoyladenylate synthase [Candidatus Limnocylindrales bacterium]|nr:L-threonylcarbamoyladenylate synthase [Candidatus Limnocylindrales bacterium]